MRPLLILPKDFIVISGEEVSTLKHLCKGCEKILADEKLSNDFWTRLGNEPSYKKLEALIKKIKEI